MSKSKPDLVLYSLISLKLTFNQMKIVCVQAIYHSEGFNLLSIQGQSHQKINTAVYENQNSGYTSQFRV